MDSPAKRIVVPNVTDVMALLENRTWEPFHPGIAISWLYEYGGGGAHAAFLRYQPGAEVPLHEHVGWEHILVLQGSQSDGQAVYTAGTLLVHGPGTQHHVVSEEGCVVLAIWERPVRFVTRWPP